MLLVQRTGWGKSAVYFIATKLLRDRGAGPTLLVSPLLALMRNQIEAAQRMGVHAVSINSANTAEWQEIKSQLDANKVDLLLISPERLANAKFRSDVLPQVGRRSGLLVIDEAHCISDWGHDFRPDYQRIVRVLDLLPVGVPVLCCTATANNRVVDDISSQLGSSLVPMRGPLARDGLSLAAIDMPQQATRLAWLAEQVPKLPGTGIVYCLTVADTERVADWLQSNGISAVAYYGDVHSDQKVKIEQDLLYNRLKVVVATTALGMGFDKPDLAFVIHYQSPSSPIAYYQQVGRAGRALKESFGILLAGAEDASIQDYFIRTAFPDGDTAAQVVSLLQKHARPITMKQIMDAIDIRPTQLEKLLKTLEVEGAVEGDGAGWQRTLKPWTYDHNRTEQVTALRRTEQHQMRQYIRTSDCRMQLLREFLDDPTARPCGICDNTADLDWLSVVPSRTDEERAVQFLRSGAAAQAIEPRKQLPDGKKIAADRRLEVGRVLAIWGDGGWGNLVRAGKQDHGRFDDELVAAAADLIRNRWYPDPPLEWVTFVPSLRDPLLVEDLAQRLAAVLDLRCVRVVMKVRDTEPQKTMQNSHHQYENVRGVFNLLPPVRRGPVLLVDDIVDSRWTLTAIGYKLRAAGVSHIYPFALADSAGKS